MNRPSGSNPTNVERDDHYTRGKSWFTHLVGSVLAFKAHDDVLARYAFDEADRLIGPFGDEGRPDAFRDFIAGAMRQAEDTILPDEPNIIEQLIEYFDANPDGADLIDVDPAPAPAPRVYQFPTRPPVP